MKDEYLTKNLTEVDASCAYPRSFCAMLDCGTKNAVPTYHSKLPPGMNLCHQYNLSVKYVAKRPQVTNTTCRV